MASACLFCIFMLFFSVRLGADPTSLQELVNRGYEDALKDAESMTRLICNNSVWQECYGARQVVLRLRGGLKRSREGR